MNKSERETMLAEMQKKTLQFIEQVTTNADKVQKQVLSEILSANSDVEYLQRHGIHGHTDLETFKKLIPVITYEDIKSDIHRIANGDASPILCQEPISEFFTSSGTSGGENKLIPKTKGDIARGWSILNLLVPVMNQYIPGLEKGKVMQFMFVKPQSMTPGGLIAHWFSTALYKSPMMKEIMTLFNPFTCPLEAIICEDTYQSMYSQLLCGLFQNNQVLRVGSPFASNFVQVIRFLEKHWTLLCNDIRTGTIHNKITDPSVRESVLKILTPAPELADLIESECGKDSWEGIISRLWPNAKYIDVIASGSMSQYIPTLDYYSNGLPIVTTTYMSSECCFAINLNPLCNPSEIAFTFIPTMAYFEFLPIEKSTADISDSNLQHELVDLVDVKLGQEYEVVITTYAGLYRYRVGDVLRVSGFKNKTPQFNFMCRKNVILSIDIEKTNELDLQNAVNNCIKHLTKLDITLEDYTTYADTSTIPGHYVFYWELRSRNTTSSIKPINIPQLTIEECCHTIEDSLNSVYRQFRGVGSIGPLEIKVLETGTFNKLMEYAVSRSAAPSQYKTPRCLNYGPLLELLNCGTISNYFSSKCPEFIPGHKKWHNQD